MEQTSGPAVLICLLGSFRLERPGDTVALRRGAKAEVLLSYLALAEGYRAGQEVLCELLWPGTAAGRAGHCLRNLVHTVQQLLREPLSGAPALRRWAGGYRLNLDAGVAVDVDRFERAVRQGERHWYAGTRAAAVACFERATSLYRGDIAPGGDLATMVVRERLRGLHLTALGRLAEHRYARGDHGGALELAMRELAVDPCRESAHRLAMLCYAGTGQRSQAIRQYHLCRHILHTEYAVAPEPATEAIFRRLCGNPGPVGLPAATAAGGEALASVHRIPDADSPGTGERRYRGGGTAVAVPLRTATGW